MAADSAFYEQAREVGEVTQRGLRYRVYYDPEHSVTICVLIPGQRETIDAPSQ